MMAADPQKPREGKKGTPHLGREQVVDAICSCNVAGSESGEKEGLRDPQSS